MTNLSRRLAGARSAVGSWAAGRFWPPRALLLAYLAYVGVRHLTDGEYTSLFGAVNLAVHEGGHLLFGCLGEFLMVAGGTALQLFAPAASAVMFWRMRDWFSIAVCAAWLATNLYNVATYVADARAQALPLVTVGMHEHVIHDWNYLLGKLGLLSLDTTLAFLLRVAAFALLWAGVAAGAWMCILMVRSPRAGKAGP